MTDDRCPDCHGRMIDPMSDRAFCAYKRTSGYGPCGVPRVPPTLREAAVALLAQTSGDRDGRNVLIPVKGPLGENVRWLDDLRYAVEREP